MVLEEGEILTLNQQEYIVIDVVNYLNQQYAYLISNFKPLDVIIAKVTIDNEGKITDVYFDETYKDSTKKTLGDAYGMFSDWGSKVGEWYQQAAALENAIIANQGTDFITTNSEGKTDAVSGCTIKVDHMVKVFNEALKKAK